MNSFLRNSIVPSLTLAVLLAGGALTVWGFAVGTLGSIYLEAHSDQQVHEVLRLTNSGKPVIESWRRRSRDPHLFYDLDRQLVAPQEIDALHGNRPDAFLLNSHLAKAQSLVHWSATTRFSIRGLNSGAFPKTNWFLQQDEDSHEHAYLVGFEEQSKQCIGYVGVRGFRLDKPALDEQFAIGARSLNIASEAHRSAWGRAESSSGDRSPVWIISDDKLYAIDLQIAAWQRMPFADGQQARTDRSVRLLPLPEPVLSMGFATEPVEANGAITDQQRLAVRTTKHVLLLDLDGNILRSAEIPASLADEYFSVFFPVGNEVIFEASSFDPNSHEVELFWVDTKSGATRSEHVVMRKPTEELQIIWFSSAVAPSPLLLTVFYYEILPYLRHPLDRSNSASAYRAEIWNATWPAQLLVCLLSVAAAAYTYRRQKRYGPRGAVVWAIFVLIAGPAGLLGYLWHRRWPIVEHCTACGADSPRDREACVACHTAFPAPKQLGCEVFA